MQDKQDQQDQQDKQDKSVELWSSSSTYNDEMLSILCREAEFLYNVNKTDLKVYIDSVYSDSEFTFKTQKKMFDCVTFTNHFLGYILMDIVEIFNLTFWNGNYKNELQDSIAFLYESLSPMTKIS